MIQQSKFRSPMLATACDSLPKGKWIAELKRDGHRQIISIDAEGHVSNWSRTGKTRVYPKHLLEVLKTFPVCVLDGELEVPGETSSSVTELTKQHLLQYVAFDVLEVNDVDVTTESWSKRRERLEEIIAVAGKKSIVEISAVTPVSTWHEVLDFVARIWDEGGEGAILKDTSAPYRCGKRTKTFLKVKDLHNVITTIVGWKAGTTGAYCVAQVREDNGRLSGVKVKNDELRAQVNADPDSFIGRRLAVEFTERTPDGNIRHGRWDHLVTEGDE